MKSKESGSVRKHGVRSGPSRVRKGDHKIAMVLPVKGEKSLDIGPNAAVKLSLRDFIHRLFVQTLGVGAFYKGPGPLEVKGGFEYLDENVGHSESCQTYDSAYRNLWAIRYLAQEIMSKFDDGTPDPLKDQTAHERFERAENLSAMANGRFSWDGVNVPVWASPRRRTPYMCPQTGEVFSLDCLKAMRYARDLLSKVIRYSPDLVRDNLYLSGHGPGATTRLARCDAHQPGKWSGSLHITAQAADFGRQFLELNPGYAAAGGSFFTYPGNLLTTVPKNWKTYRFIAIEPEGNMLYQKCIAVALRRALLAVGINLRDQTKNRNLASTAATTGLATWDGSMMSDTVSIGVCSYLIPRGVFDHVMKARSPVGFEVTRGRTPLFEPDGSGGFTVANGRMVTYNKVSSMGNGTTFELETAILWGLAMAACRVTGSDDTSVSVYGDDVILPSTAYSLFTECVKFCGFVTNDDKSYHEGPFRESCGGHYWCDTDVTPFYIREEVTHLDRLFLLHNNVRRWFQRNPGICDPNKVRVLLAWLRSHAPAEWRRPRLYSSNIGDGAFVGKPTIAVPPKNFWDSPRTLADTRRYQGWEGLGVNVLTYQAKKPDKELDRDRSYDDRKAPYASLWNGTSYEVAAIDRLEHLADPLEDGYADVPWKQRYWSVGIQVYVPEEASSWF